MTQPDDSIQTPTTPANRFVEFGQLGQLLANLESSERAYEANSRMADEQEAKHGHIVAIAARIQASALLFQPNRARMPGIDRLEALVNESYGTKLTAESIRKIRGKICRILKCGTEEADKLTMLRAVEILESHEGIQQVMAKDHSLHAGVGPMELLLTWSGTGSHDIATFFRNWLPEVVPDILPWISSQDIAKGKKWSNELTKQMNKTNISITFITPENVRSPWVFYEVGFIAAKLEEGTVCPYLIGVDKGLVKDTPLGQFQWTEANKPDTLALIQSINKELGDKKHNEKLIERNFNSQWGKLKKKLDKLVEDSTPLATRVEQTETSTEEKLSAEARQLLIAATQGVNGRILYRSDGDGTTLNAGSGNLVAENTTRCIANWRAALDELKTFRLIADLNGEGMIFDLTREGFRIADLITDRVQ